MANNQWTDSSGNALPADWTPTLPLVPNGNWTCSCGCDPPGGTASVDNIRIIGSPGTITSVQDDNALWSLVLSDGTPENDMRLDRFDDTGVFAGTPFWASRATGVVTFNSPVMLSRDPVEPMEPVTLEYLESYPSGIPDAPDNQTYGRMAGAWNLVVPAAGGTFTGQTNLSAGGAVTGGALLFAGNAVCSIPTVAQLQLGGGSLGQVPATDGNGNLSWITPVTGGPYLPIAGGTITGSLTVNQVLTVQGPNSLVLNAPLNNPRAILAQAAGITRWVMNLGDQTNEGLNNVGANFSLQAYSTTGVSLGTWLSIARADGSTTFNGSGVTIQGGLSVNGLLALADLTHLAIYGGSAGQVLTTNGSGILSWTTPSGGGGGISDAPNDGTAYARKSLGWSHLTHNDITDWASSVPAPYVLPTASTTVLGGVRVDGSTITIAGGVISSAGGPGGPPVTISDTAPSGATAGALWWDSVGGQLYVWFTDANSSQWVAASNMGAALSGYLPLTGGTITGNLIVNGQIFPNSATINSALNVSGVASLVGGITPSTTLGITGTTAGDNANAGSIGEVISSVPAGLSFPNASAQTVAGITLSPGDWDVQGEINFAATAATMTAVMGTISPVAASAPGAVAMNASGVIIQAPFTGLSQRIALAPCRASLSVSAPYYLSALVNFGSGTVTVTGKIWARRAR